MSNPIQQTGFSIAAPPDWYNNATNWIFGAVAIFAVFEIAYKIATGKFARVRVGKANL